MSLSTTEKRTLTTIQTVRLLCPCGEEMVSAGKAITIAPPRYPHQCPACKRKEITDRQYPYLEYQENPEIIMMSAKEFEERVKAIHFRK